MSTLLLPPGTGRSVRIRDTKRTTFKVTGADTEGRFGLFEHEMAPEASGASAHYHKETIEMFYVLDGEVEFSLDGEVETGGPGTFILVPKATPHGFSNTSRAPAKMLIMFSPANSRERYFERLAELTADGRTPTLDELVELMERYDQYLLP